MLRFASFNLLHGRSVTDGKVDLDRLAAAVADLDADVLALQEAERHQPRSHGADLTALAAAAAGARYHHFAPAIVGLPGLWFRARRTRPSGRAGRARHRSGPTPAPWGSGWLPAYGIGLVSRYPADWVRRLDLDPPGPRINLRRRGPWRFRILTDEPRVALAARLRTPAGPLTVVATHLSPIAGRGEVQLERLARACADLPRPLVVLGDLNVRAPHPARITGWEPLATALTFPVTTPDRQLDHVLGDGTVRAEGAVAVDTGVSDHRALVVVLRLGTEQA